MPELDRLRPTEARRVMDLVQEAGIDVSDWADYGDGTRSPAANPRYCYEWAFVASGQVVILNLWHRGMQERSGVIYLRDNLRQQAMLYARMPGKGTWRKRAERFDQAVAIAAAEQLPVRAIVLDGQVRDHTRSESVASRVQARLLDPVPWAVTEYDEATGQFTVTRGALPGRMVDQFALNSAPDSPTEDRDVHGKVFVRSPLVRQKVLQRAEGRCEWCREYGFTMGDGSVFLETHHVIPLSENGADSMQNVVALCPNHHREAHHGAARALMREILLGYLSEHPNEGVA